MHTISPPSISLTLLGGAVVERPSGALTARGVRGRRLALLAMLATSRARRMTRDRLVAVLWPEANAERARPLLSDTLYLARAAIGEDAIVTAGDEIALNPERVTSDVETFERLLADREPELAVGAYGGPFLDGFHVADAIEFERWVDGERARLAGAFASALSQLAEREGGRANWSAEVGWLRRLSAHDPYSGDVALRLMRALRRSGNRAGALQHARIHAALVREEFGAEPDAELRALVDELREDSVATRVSSMREIVVDAAASSDPGVEDESTVKRIAVADAADGVADQVADQVAVVVTDHVAVNERNDTRIVVTRDACHPPERRDPDTGRTRHAFAMLATASLAAALLLTVGAWRGTRATAVASPMFATDAVAGPPQQSIAVLPFEDLGRSHVDAWFSDGLTEEVIGLLGRVSGLRVAARSSSFALRHAQLDARRMGDTLHVATLLEGSVRRDGQRIRVSARLVDAATGYQLWSSSYDRRMDDVIALQRDLANAIVNTLQLQLASPTRHDPTPSLRGSEVYQLYLRGSHARNTLSRDGLARAVDYFDRAIQLDSGFAPAWAGKATTIGPMIWSGMLSRTQGAPMLRAAARRAVELDESLPEAHIALGMSDFFLDWEWTHAERAFRRAIALNANNAIAHHFLANVLRAMGRFDEMLEARARALELDPLSVRSGMMFGADLLIAGQLDAAADAYRRASELEPNSPTVVGNGPHLTMGIGHVYERQRNGDAALREYLRIDSMAGVTPMQRAGLAHAYKSAGLSGYWRARATLVERDPSSVADPVRLAWMWARAGETERVIDYLLRAHRERALGLVYLAVLPDFGVARTDARVQRLMSAMRLTGPRLNAMQH